MPKRRTGRANRAGRATRARTHRSRGAPVPAIDPRIHALVRRIGEHGFDWEELADDILPVFERARPPTYDVEPPAHAIVPPGVTIGFGMDLGPAFARVGLRHLDAWSIDLARLTERALENLRRRARKARDYDLVADSIDGVPAVVFQSRDGWASTAVLIPEAIERLFGPAPALFIAPSRDLLLALPVDTDAEFATWLAEELEADDPNALCLEGFEWRDGTVRCRPLARDAVAI